MRCAGAATEPLIHCPGLGLTTGGVVASLKRLRHYPKAWIVAGRDDEDIPRAVNRLRAAGLRVGVIDKTHYDFHCRVAVTSIQSLNALRQFARVPEGTVVVLPMIYGGQYTARAVMDWDLRLVAGPWRNKRR